jgi:hypothetical protein
MAGKGDAKRSAKKGAKGRKIEINGETADLLQARAAALGISVGELIAAVVGHKPASAPQAANGEAQAAKDGAQTTARDAPPAQAAPPDARWREVKAWIDSWGKPDEKPRPKLGK